MQTVLVVGGRGAKERIHPARLKSMRQVEMNREAVLVQALARAGIGSRKGVMKVYADAFRGMEAIAVWMQRGLIRTLEEGIEEGRLLLKFGCIQQLAVSKKKEFLVNSLYRISFSGTPVKPIVETGAEFSIKDDKLVQILEESNIMGIRRHKFRRVGVCFQGHEAVKVWVAAGAVRTLYLAVKAGERLMRNRRIRAVNGAKRFENNALLYRLEETDRVDEDAKTTTPFGHVVDNDETRGSVTRISALMKSFAPQRKSSYTSSSNSGSETDEETDVERSSLYASFGKRLNSLSSLSKNLTMDVVTIKERENSTVPFFEDRTVPFFEIAATGPN